FRCIPQDTGFTCHTIHLSTRMHINASSGSECKISRDEIPYFTQAFLYRKLLNLAYLSAKPPRIIIEQYATTLLKEIKINLRAPTLDDQLLSAYILEPVTDKVYLLCKWKKSRWHLHPIALD
ncbi:MAG: hypothetical protein RMK00_09410, partial [Bacteroidota bacterium]|nr:hypothetical protein [Bacteroidota bacterium]